MKKWLNRAMELLRATLEPPKHEINELDWKGALSPDKKRLSEHLSAFANQPGGGFLVFGVDASGTAVGVTEEQIESVINQLANLGRDALEPRLVLDHTVATRGNARLLFVHVAESVVKPVHLRGKSLEHAFIRSGGTSRVASRQEIGAMMLHSRTPRWEELHASCLCADDELVSQLNGGAILKIQERPVPLTTEQWVAWMAAERFVSREPTGGGFVTNLGAISTAHSLSAFPDLVRKSVRIVVYDGVSKIRTRQEKEMTQGYASSFQALMEAVISLLPQGEVVEKGLRTTRTVYPELALREIIANALIHQDFTVSGTGPMIEIFDDRLEVSNPGALLPSKTLDRLIGTQPESRNERLARAFRLYKICEERGSGLLKAAKEVESRGLPPIHFAAGPNFFKVTLWAPRTFAQMSPRERMEACYQHAVLKHFSGGVMTNTSLRERLMMPEKHRPMVSVIIQEALSQKLIKPADPESKSKKFAEYVPYWM